MGIEAAREKVISALNEQGLSSRYEMRFGLAYTDPRGILLHPRYSVYSERWTDRGKPVVRDKLHYGSSIRDPLPSLIEIAPYPETQEQHEARLKRLNLVADQLSAFFIDGGVLHLPRSWDDSENQSPELLVNSEISSAEVLRAKLPKKIQQEPLLYLKSTDPLLDESNLELRHNYRPGRNYDGSSEKLQGDVYVLAPDAARLLSINEQGWFEFSRNFYPYNTPYDPTTIFWNTLHEASLSLLTGRPRGLGLPPEENPPFGPPDNPVRKLAYDEQGEQIVLELYILSHASSALTSAVLVDLINAKKGLYPLPSNLLHRASGWLRKKING
jgi:hypothetical protein